MVAATYTFTGQSQVGYYSYADLETGKMLIAEPGETYGIRATEEGFPVPPGDGRWVAAPAAPPGPTPAAAKPAAVILAAGKEAAA